MPLFKKIKENNCEIGIWELSETLDYLIKKSDFSEINKITSRQRKKEILASRILLKNMYPDLKIKYNKYGAPTVENNKFISISHSKKFVTIILSRIKVGIDIQEINDKALNAVSKFINLGNSNQISKNEATLVWSCKECIYKWYQKGSVNFLNDIKIHSFKIKEKGKITANFKNQEFTLFYRKLQNHFLVYVCK